MGEEKGGNAPIIDRMKNGRSRGVRMVIRDSRTRTLWVLENVSRLDGVDM